MSYTESYRRLKDIGFEPKTNHAYQDWYTCVVVSMFHVPDKAREIAARADEVAQELERTEGLNTSSRHKSWINPCFHLGEPRARRYHSKYPTVGNKSFNELEPYCVKHSELSWRKLINEETCDEYCRYGLRIRER